MINVDHCGVFAQQINSFVFWESLRRRELSNGRDCVLKYITPPHSNGWYVPTFPHVLRTERTLGTWVRSVREYARYVSTLGTCSWLSTWLGYPSSHGSTGSIESTTSRMSSLSNRNTDITRSVTNGLNITSNWITIFSNIYPIFIKEVLKILNNINITKCLGVGDLFYKILPKIFP